MTTGPRIVVRPLEVDDAGRAEALAQRLAAVGLAVEVGPAEVALGDELVVVVAQDGLRLSGRLPTGVAGFRLDYTVGSLRRRFASARGSLLAKALGKARGGLVVDATAGLGRDTLVLAALGPVVAIERHPLIFALLEDAWGRAGADPALAAACSRVELVRGEAAAWLAEATRSPAAVVVDPMFEQEEKAAVKKEMQLLRRLMLAGEDGRSLLEAARGGRVVVKRPRHGVAVAPGVTRSLPGRGFRWDVYG